jgi:hypothetical protein
MTTPENAKLHALIEFASEQISKLFKNTGKVLPMYHAVTADGQTLILNAPHKDKDISVGMIKIAFAKLNVERYVFMDEAWILDTQNRVPGPDEWKRIERDGLSEHPDRREILMLTAEDRHGNIITAHRYILRPEHGKAKLSPLEIRDMTEGHSVGRMVGLLRPHF